MSERLKISLYIAAGAISAILLFCLIIIIGCSVNGLTFGEQVSSWFGSSGRNSIKKIANIALNIKNYR